MTRGHLSSDRPAADLAPPPTGPAPGAERPWLQHEGCDQRIAGLEADVTRLREALRRALHRGALMDDVAGEFELVDKRRVLSLCDRTGVMVQPWLDAGFPCTIVDLQHPHGAHAEGLLTKVGADVTKWLPPMDDYAIVFAFPPCTHLAKSGARWWKKKGLTALIEALTVVDACRRTCEQTGAPYLIENPSGALSTHWRKPDYAFDPLDFGAYVLDGEDYTKLTNLWVGGGFVMPEKRPLPMSDEPNPIHWAPPSPDRADRRSITPRGFAQAVFEANSGCGQPLAVAAQTDSSEGSDG